MPDGILLAHFTVARFNYCSPSLLVGAEVRAWLALSLALLSRQALAAARFRATEQRISLSEGAP